MKLKYSTQPVFTVSTTAVNTDIGLFQDPSLCGSFFSYDRARSRLKELVAREKKRLDNRYNTEKCEETVWEMYEDGYAAGCFARIEIIESEIEDWGVEK